MAPARRARRRALLLGAAAGLARAKLVLHANGASFPERLYQEANFAYKFVNPSVEVVYVSTGSGKGQCRIKNFTQYCSSSDSEDIAPAVVDFVGSDSLLQYPRDFDLFPDLQMYPAVAGAVVPIYNLAGHNSSHPPLVLTTLLLAKIFGGSRVEGSITTWNHSAIVALNPELHALGLLRDIPIKVVVREDSSGTTEIFTKALSAFDPTFAAVIGGTSSASKWSPSVTRADTNGGVAAVVLTTPNSIGYSVLAEATALDLPMASISVQGGVVAASTEAVEFALVEKGTLFGNNGLPPASLTADIHATSSPRAWPIAGYTYLIMRKSTTHFSHGQSCRSRLETVKYWKWFWTSDVVKQIAVNLGFVVLPDVVRRVVLQQLLDDITCNDERVFVPPATPTVYGVGLAMMSSIFRLYVPAYGAAASDVALAFSDSIESASSIAPAIESVLSASLVTGDPIASAQAFAVAPASAVSAELAASNAIIPFAGVAIAICFSRCGSSVSGCALANTELVLSISQLADILDGTIKSWADSRLRANNPWLEASSIAMSAREILLVGEAESSETLTLLRDILSIYKPGISFASTFGPGGSAFIEPTIDRVLSRTINTVTAIGITPLVGTIHPLLHVVPLMVSSFSNGRRLQTTKATRPSPDSIAACATDTYLPDERNFDGRFNLRSSLNPGCYPLSEAIVILVRRTFRAAECDQSNSTVALPVRLANFIQWLNSDSSRAPITTAEMAPLSAVKPSFTTVQINSLLCDGVPIIAPAPSPPPLLPIACKPGQVLEYRQGLFVCEPCPKGTYELDNRLCRKAPSSGYVNISGATESDIIDCPAWTRHLTLVLEGFHVSMVPATGATSEAQCVCDVGYFLPTVFGLSRPVNETIRDDSHPRTASGGLTGAASCVACPDGAVCLGGYIQPFAQTGYAMIGRSRFAECFGKRIGACGKTPDFRSCDCPGGDVDLSSLNGSEIVQLDEIIVNERVVPFRCGDSYMNNTRLCAKCLTDGNDNYGVDSQGKCSPCSFGNVFYLFATAAFVSLWFPTIRYLNLKKMRSMYTTLAFLQFVGFYSYGFNVPWSRALRDFTSVFNSFNLNLNFTQLSCLVSSYESRWATQLLLPALLPVCGILMILCNKLCSALLSQRWLQAMDVQPLGRLSCHTIFEHYGPPFLFYLNMYMYQGAATSLEMFVCLADDDGEYLASYPPLTCWGASHLPLVGLAVLGVAFYVVGYTASYIHILYFKVPRMCETAVGAKRAGKFFGFLYLRFSADHSSFEMFELLRKLSFAFIAKFGQQWVPVAKNFIALCVLWTVIMIQTAKHPFAVPLYDLYGEVTLAAEVIIVTVGLVIVARAQLGVSTAVGEPYWLEIAVWLAIIATLIMGVLVSISDLWIDYRLRRIKRRAKETGLTLSPQCFAITMNSYLVPDMVEAASPEEIDRLIACERLIRTQILDKAAGRSLKERNKMTRAEWQSEFAPYLLDTMLGTWKRDDGSEHEDEDEDAPVDFLSQQTFPSDTTSHVNMDSHLPSGSTSELHHKFSLLPMCHRTGLRHHGAGAGLTPEPTSDASSFSSMTSRRQSVQNRRKSVTLKKAMVALDELTQSFHNSESVRGRMPSIYFFQKTLIGPLLYWLSTDADDKEKSIMRDACVTMQELRERRRLKNWVRLCDGLGMSKLVLHREHKMCKAMRASSKGDNAALQSGFVLSSQKEALGLDAIIPAAPTPNKGNAPQASSRLITCAKGTLPMIPSRTRVTMMRHPI